MRVRAAAAAGIIAGAGLLAPACAGAATVTMTADAGPAANTYVFYRAAPGEGNQVTVRLRKETLLIFDHGVARLRFHDSGFGRCDRIRARALVCPRAPVVALLRDGDDTFRATPSGHGHDHRRKNPLALQQDYTDTEGAIVEETIVSAGSGDDIVLGSRGFDSIAPGSGRDIVNGRGGGDTVYADRDDRHDRLSGGPGIDGVDFGAAKKPVTVNLELGTAAGGGGRVDSLAGFERVHGGPYDDHLRGTPTGEALYGEDGSDDLVGGSGNDLLVGDSPIASRHFPNTFAAGRGSDVIDARGYAQAPPPSNAHLTSAIDCGRGRDRVLGETDDRLKRSCEGAVFRIPNSSGYLPDETDLYGVAMKVWPVARDDASVTYEVPCPAIAEESNAGCSGSIALSHPPFGGEAPDILYGSASFDLEPGERKAVRVELTAEGRQAAADGSPVDVQLSSDLSQGAGVEPEHARFGWEPVLGPG
jgi:Ca2+-binding RTX toxin-like protein